MTEKPLADLGDDHPRDLQPIVVGADDSDDAREAIGWAARIAATTGSGLEIVRVSPKACEVDDLASLESVVTSAGDLRLDGTDVVTRTVTGDPRRALLEASRTARLLVVGRRSTSRGPGVLHLGSTVEYLAHHAKQPLAVIGGLRRHPVNHVVVGYDSSEGSSGALAWAAEALRGQASRLTVIAVTGRPTGRREIAHAERELRDRLEPMAKQAGFDLSVVVRQAQVRVASEILWEAKRVAADLVVVGTRGTGGFSELRIGKVAMRVLHDADRPMVLVPPRGGT